MVQLRHIKSVLFVLTLCIALFINKEVYAQDPYELVDTLPKFKDTEFILSVNGDTRLAFDSVKYWGFSAAISRALFYDDIFNIYYGLRYTSSKRILQNVSTETEDHLFNVKYSFNTIAVPILFRMNFGRKFRFYLEFGFSFEYNLRVHEKGILTNVTDSTFCIGCPPIGENISSKLDDFKKFDLGMNLGGGFIIIGRRVSYKIGGSYHLGGFNILLDQKYYVTDLHNNYWKFSVGIFFRKYNKAAKTSAKF